MDGTHISILIIESDLPVLSISPHMANPHIYQNIIGALQYIIITYRFYCQPHLLVYAYSH